MADLILDATPRGEHGKMNMRRMRRNGRIPGVVYGLNPPVSLQFGEKQASQLVHQLHGGERLVTLRFQEDGKEHPVETRVLLKEVQVTPLGRHLLHIDLQEVDITRTIQVSIELRPIGTANGVKLGGILQAVRHEIEVECLPLEIPEKIEVDVSALEIGDSLHVKDLVFSENVKPVTDQEETIIVVSAPRVEVEEEAPAEEVPEEGVEAEAPAAEAPEAEKTPSSE